jgi:hypothetical protein
MIPPFEVTKTDGSMGGLHMKIDGGCHCGAITYEAEVDPRRTILCHCTDCQTISGGPYRVNVPVLLENFHLTGEPRRYRKRADSDGATAFCPTCGAALFSEKPGRPYVFLRLGGARQRAELPPTAQGFCRSAMPWAMDISAVPMVGPT